MLTGEGHRRLQGRGEDSVDPENNEEIVKNAAFCIDTKKCSLGHAPDSHSFFMLTANLRRLPLLTALELPVVRLTNSIF